MAVLTRPEAPGKTEPAAAPGSPRPRARRRTAVHLTLALLCLAWVVPVVGLFVSSLRTPYDITDSGWWHALLPPYAFTLDNYREVLTTGGLGRAFANSLLISVPAVSVMTAIGSVAAYAFARMRFPGRRPLFIAVTTLLVVPAQMAIAPVLRLYHVVHLAGTFTGIWMVHVGFALPFAIYLLRNFMADLPEEIFEAAAVDGASPPTVFLRIALPTSAAAIASFAIFQFLWVWNDLLLALVFLGGDQSVAPLTLAVSNLVNANTGQGWQLLTAAAFVSMAFPLLIFLALQRYFVRGLLAGMGK